jgi:hypothetical protein
MDLLSIIIESRKRVDPDAAAYFARIEAAGSSINFNNRNAVNQFIVGCKEDGIWNAIKASCILAGADTLSGALVPLVGDAPTNFNFVETDYSVTTGLIGDGSTKYLDSGYALTQSLQNNRHCSVYAQTTQISGISVGVCYMGTSLSTNTGTARTQILALEGSPLRISTRLADVSTRTSTNNLNAVGLIGISRSISTNYTQRGAMTDETPIVTSLAGDDTNMTIFRRPIDSSPLYTNARISFYSIGENLDLALLDARLATLMSSLRPTVDPDALDYFTRVEAAGSTINADNKNAINQFIVGCKEDGNWSKIKASCILAGADTLSGALVPLVGPEPTTSGFTEADYSTITGLQGGFPRRFDTGRADNADPQNDCHTAVWVTGTGSGTTLGIVGSDGSTGIPQRRIHRSNTTCNDTVASNYTITTGLLGITRSLSGSYIRRNNNTNVTVNNASTGTSAANVALFARNVTGTSSWPGKLSFYSIGESINLALLDTRLTQLMNSLRSSSYDADALAYFARIEAAGSTINESNKNAVNEFIIGCKEDGNWSKIKASCILAGADTLSGALQPLVGTAPTPFFFEESNYSRINGLISNGTTSYLNSNRNDSADTKDNASMCLCITQHSSEYLYYASSTNFNGAAGRVLGRNGPSGVVAMCNNGGASATVTHSRPTATLPAFVGISRSNPADYSFRYGGVTDTVIKTSSDPNGGPIHIFKQGNNNAVASYSDVRLSFYSIGESINLDLLDTRITKLMNSLI